MNWRLGVIGSPITHSLSPRLHVTALRQLGLEGASEAVEITSAADVPGLLPERFDALSVTMPLKVPLCSLCDELDPSASRVGAVNSILWRDGKLWGANTDGEGFVSSLRGELEFDVTDRHVVMLGSGGAARGIVDALVANGAATVAVLSRNSSTAAALAHEYENVFDHAVRYRPIDLIVNTIPISSRAGETAVLHGVSGDTVAVDITYEPRLSAWRNLYERHGCRTLNGLPMLAYQAAIQLRWWLTASVDPKSLLEEIS